MAIALTILQVLTLICSVSTMILVSIYAIGHPAGHTEMDPRFVSAPFIAVLLIGALTAVRPTHRRLALSLIAFAICGMLFGFFIHETGVIRQYGHWMEAGRPEQHQQTELLMLGYTFVSVLIAFCTYRFSIKPRHKLGRF
jgi:peptidoglycan/LPS O-acetylase OafA/YrhL